MKSKPPRKFSINPVSDFLYEERQKIELEERRAFWRDTQNDKITACDITSADYEKIVDDIYHGRRGMTTLKALAMVEDASVKSIIPSPWYKILTDKIK